MFKYKVFTEGKTKGKTLHKHTKNALFEVTDLIGAGIYFSTLGEFFVFPFYNPLMLNISHS